MHIHKVSTNPKALEYLKARGLRKQFDKQVDLILRGFSKQTDLKKREPKKHNIRSFKINDQFRALCKISGNELFVLEIDNHQGY